MLLQFCVVLGQDIDRRLEKLLGTLEVCDVSLVGLILLGALLRLILLALEVRLQALLSAGDHRLQAHFRCLDVGLQSGNGAIEAQDLSALLLDGPGSGRPLHVAPLKLLLVGRAFFRDECDHLLDLCQHNVEGVVGPQQRRNFPEPLGAASASANPLQEQRRLQPGAVCLIAAAMAAHHGRTSLKENFARARGRHRAEGFEGGILVQNCDGLRNGSVLLCTEHVPLLELLCLLLAHREKLRQHVLANAFLLCGLAQLLSLGGEVAIVGAQGALFLVMQFLHRLVRRERGGHVLSVGVELRLFRLGCCLQIFLEGVPHVLENANHLTGLCRICGREGSCLKQRRHGIPLLPPCRHEGRGGGKRLLHSPLQLQ
mmetsp:Transcript_114803/g.245069  ORF Transcript_114803/g.245069 Transcript_114803/m.245069 type:complete len:371 (+) Transcript_114803:688-1800(+)